jgi:hypothetical protein
MQRGNIAKMLLFHKLLGFGPSDLYTYGSATATINKDLATGAVILDTIGTANNYLVSKIMGVSPSLTTAITAQSKMQFHGNITNVYVRWGVNAEPMDVSNNTQAKWLIESCPGVNGNWNIVTADGNDPGTRTSIDANASLDGSTTVTEDDNARSFVLDYLPGNMVNFHYHTNIVISKQTQMPNTGLNPGAIPANNVMTWGLKTSDTNAKQLYIWGVAMHGGINDNAWRQVDLV